MWTGNKRMKEFNLSEKSFKPYGTVSPVIWTKDVKEFIKRDWTLTNDFIVNMLKGCNFDAEFIYKQMLELKQKKDKLAGDKLK